MTAVSDISWFRSVSGVRFRALTPFTGRQEGHSACKRWTSATKNYCVEQMDSECCIHVSIFHQKIEQNDTMKVLITALTQHEHSFNSCFPDESGLAGSPSVLKMQEKLPFRSNKMLLFVHYC